MQSDRRNWRRDLVLVLSLILVGVAVKGWLVFRSEVLARDGVGYIQYAARLEAAPLQQKAWKDILKSEQQHPLYPLHILATHQVLKAISSGEADSLTWQTSAQIASLIGGVLLAWPMFLLGRDLFDRRVGFWGALLFQVLPVPARVTADALSEGTYLFWVAWAVCLAIRGLQTRQPGWFILTGITAALAYLVRPEGALVIGLAGTLLLVMQVIPNWRMPWPRLLTCGGALTLAAILTAIPYWYAIEHVSNKPSARELLNKVLHRVLPADHAHPDAPPAPTGQGSLLLASRFSEGTDGLDRGDVGALFALYEVLDEVCKAFYYVTWVPAVLGFWWYRRRMGQTPGLLLAMLLVLVNLLVLWLLATRVHYVSERHTLLVVLCCCPLTVATLFHWRDRLATGKAGWWCWFQQFGVQIGLLALLGVALLQTLKPLHSHRIGHKAVGLWLGRQLKPGDSFVDPYGLASFYADRRLAGQQDDSNAAIRKAHRYLLVEPADRDLQRRQLIEHEQERMGLAEMVFAWPHVNQPELLVYKSSKKRLIAAEPAAFEARRASERTP